MSTLSRTLGRALVASGAALALGSATLLGASAANADDASDQAAIDFNSGEVIVRGDAYLAGYTLEVWAPIPDGSGDYLLQTGEFEPDADADGYSAAVSNLAGPVHLEIVNYSGLPETGDVSAEATDEDEDANAAIWRGATAVYDFEATAGDAGIVVGDFTLEGNAPVVTAPDSEQLGLLFPVVNDSYVVEPSTYKEGEAFTAKFSNITSAYDDRIVGEQEPTVVSFYGYSAPKAIGQASIVGGRVEIAIPVEYTTGSHTVASFDQFGRLFVAASLNGGVASDAKPAAKPALANTGAGDSTGALTIGLGVLALGAAAVAGGLVLRRRSA